MWHNKCFELNFIDDNFGNQQSYPLFTKYTGMQISKISST